MTGAAGSINYPAPAKADPIENGATAQQEPGQQLKFAANNDFLVELRRRVDGYFATTGRRPRDCSEMYFKTAIVLTWFVSSYLLLVFWATAWWHVVPLLVSLGFSMAAIGFNIQHDGSHHAYSDRTWVNRLAATTLDVIGVSSVLWHRTHNVIHHTYVNIAGHDTDIDLGPLARLSPHQRWRSFHRFQHWYIWPLYCLFTIKWHFVDDFFEVVIGRIGPHRVPALRPAQRAVFVGGKVISFSLSFWIPLLWHSPGVVLLCYAAVSCILGLTLSLVFQLAHCVEEADFPLPRGTPARIETPWAVHQAQTSVNVACRNPALTWFLGGLNFQIEHHLLPRICHIHYPDLSPLVKATCREFGVRYAVHESFFAGLASHYRWLRRMGRPAAEGCEAPTAGCGHG